ALDEALGARGEAEEEALRPPPLDEAVPDEEEPEPGQAEPGEAEPGEEKTAPPATEAAKPAPTLDEALNETEAETGAEPETLPTFFYALSDPPSARVYLAPSSARVADLLKQARPAGRTPAEIKLPPGPWYPLVE